MQAMILCLDDNVALAFYLSLEDERRYHPKVAAQTFAIPTIASTTVRIKNCVYARSWRRGVCAMGVGVVDLVCPKNRFL